MISKSSADTVMCCEQLKQTLYNSASVKKVNNKYMESFGVSEFQSEWFDINEKTVKVGQIYAYNDELDELDSYPFRYCPFCGKELII